MRGVCQSWQQGFEGSVKKMKISFSGPSSLPKDFSLRFWGLTSLDLGGSRVAEPDLVQLAGLKRLRSLILGEPYSMPPSQATLSFRLTGSELHHLGGLPLDTLSLQSCPRLSDLSLEGLRGLLLTSLNMSWCNRLEGSGFSHLKKMPLGYLDLGHCLGVEDLEGLQDLPLTSLKLRSCGEVRSLKDLCGMPLTSLDLGWTGIRDNDFVGWGGMPLTDLSLDFCKWVPREGLEQLRGAPLSRLDLCECSLQDSDLAALMGLPLNISQPFIKQRDKPGRIGVSSWNAA